MEGMKGVSGPGQFHPKESESGQNGSLVIRTPFDLNRRERGHGGGSVTHDHAWTLTGWHVHSALRLRNHAKEEPYSGDHVDNKEEHEHTSAQDSGAASGVYLSRGHIPRRS